MQFKPSWLAAKVTLIYVIVVGAWISFSDGLLIKMLFRDPGGHVHLSTVKGWGLVVMTGILLYLALRRILSRSELEAEKRRRAEAAQRESEARYRQLFVVATDAVFLVDLQAGQILEANPTAEKMYGYNADEFLRLKVTDLSAEPEKTTQALAANTVFIPLRLHRRKDGSFFPVEICCSDIIHQNRKIHVAVIRDITQRQQAKSALLESEMRFRSLFENMNEGVAHCRMIFKAGRPVDFVYLAVNPMFTALTGLEAVVGKRATEVISGLRESDPDIFEIYGRVAATGKPEKFERFVQALQSWFAVSVFSPQPDHFVALFDVVTERKRMEEEMRHISRWLLTTQRISKVGGWTVNLKNGAAWASPEAARIYGANHDQQFTLPLIQSFPLPQFRSMLDAALRELIAGRQPYDVEFQIVRGTDGALVDIHSVAEYDAEEDIVQGVIEDITERKQAERVVQRQAAFARHNPNPVLELSATGEVLYSNAAALKMAGALGKNHPADILPANIAAIVRDCLATTQPMLRLETSAGDRIISWSFFPVADSRVVHGYAGDITERKRAETALRDSELLLRSIMDNSKDIIFVKDRECRFVFMNPAGYRLTGLTPENLLGCSKADFHPDPAEAAQFMVDDRRVMESGQMETIEEEFGTADGSRHTFLTSKVPRRDSDGKIIGLIGVAHDITGRKRVELELKYERDLWRMMLDNSPDHIYFKDVQSRFIKSSNAQALQFGLKSPTEMVGKTDFDFFTEAHARPAFEDEQEIIRTGRPMIDKEEREVWNDNRVTWASSTKMPMRDASGKIIGIMGISRDITGRKLVESALRESEERYKALFDRSLDCVFLSDFDGQLLDANRVTLDLLGYQRDDIANLNFATLLTVDQLPLAFRTVEEVKATGHQMHSTEFRFRTKDGRLVQLETQSSLIYRDGEPYAIQGIGRDITERRQAEAAQARLATAVEQAAESVVITDTHGTILYVNPAFENNSGYSRTEVLGQNPRILKSGKHSAEFYSRIWEVLRSGETWSGHFINRRKDGTFYEEEATISPVRDAAGKVVNYVAVKRDVTREVQLEAQFRQSQKMEAIGQLAGGVAHDFNNILAVIQLQAGLLKSEPGVSVQQRECASDIERATQRAANLTRQLLLFSRKQALQPRDLDLNEVVTGITKMLQRVVGEQIQMQFKLATQPLLVHADVGMMDQVLMNLTVNARDAMSQGGQLMIETSFMEFDEHTAAQSAQARPGLFACVSVRDTGSGIPPENIPRIFDPFFTTKEVGKGSGLGLATVFGIVQQHQGWISVYSDVGRGTTFRIYLPRLLQPADKAVLWPSFTTFRGGTETILLVEDDVALRAVVQKSLSRLGYQVLEAANGVAAMEVWKERHAEIRLLLTDLVMPGMTGKDLASQILAQEPRLKVIYTSGYSAEIASKDFPLEDGVNFLTKPYEVPRLARTIRQCLDQD